MSGDERQAAERMHEKRDYSYEADTGILYNHDPEFARRYDQFAEYTLRRDDELSRKNRELIIIAFALSEKNPEAARNHMAAALKYGASMDEIFQTIHLTKRLASAWVTIIAAEAIETLEPAIDALDVDVEELDVDLEELRALRSKET